MSEVHSGGPVPPSEGKKPVGLLALLLVLLVVPAYGAFNWFLCRIEVPAKNIAVLIAKTGDPLPQGHVIARKGEQKGIQLQVLMPGRHFRNPLFWDWKIHPYTNIPEGQVGVMTRHYGDSPNLEESLLVPQEGHMKGIVREVLKPGDYPINPYAYQVKKFPAVNVKAGFVGVQCDMVGRRAEQANQYLVETGARGVQRAYLGQGDHYLNPYAMRVYNVDVRAQRLEFTGSAGATAPGTTRKDLSALRFPSSDGFEIVVHLVVEWSIDSKRAPEVFVRIGSGDPKTLLQDVLHKTLIPALRGFARIQGSKYPAADYISGESRTRFQTAIFEALKPASAKQGVLIRSVVVNDIVPPQDIAEPIRQREVAKEELTRNEIQLEQAIAEQSLARQTSLIEQEKVRVLSETELATRKIQVENAQSVALIEQEKLLNVAKADFAASKLEAEAILARGKAEAAVIVANNEAEAAALKASVDAFKTPSSFASYTFAQRIAPSVQSVFADPDGPFGQLFKDLFQPRQAGQGGQK